MTAKEASEYTKTSSDFERLAVDLKVPFANTSGIVSQKAMLEQSESDIAVSLNYTGVIPQNIIDLFPLGVLNAHGGDLPRYRGNACQAWAILNGEERIGLCIHKMVGGELDSGDIIAREYMPIDHNTKITTVWSWMNQRIPELFLKAVNQLSVDPDYVLEIQSRNPKNALRCYPRRPEDGRIDWHKPAIDVLRLINASNKPYAGGFCNFEGEKMIIWDAELVEDYENFCALPGQVTIIGDGFVEVAAAIGKVRIKCVEIKGYIGKANSVIKTIRKRLE